MEQVMFLEIKPILRMSLMRNAVQLSVLFIIILFIAGLTLRVELSNQLYEEIDNDLLGFSEILNKNQSIKNNLINKNYPFNIFTGVLRKDNSIQGMLNSDIFTKKGFQTLSADALFDHDNAFISLTHQDHNSLWRVLVEEVDGDFFAIYTPLHEVEDILHIFSVIMLPITLAIVISTLVGGVFLGFFQQKRITKIKKAFIQISNGNLKYRLAPKKINDDIDDLMVGFDDAANKLETSIYQMTSFSKNIAHELRTPLAELRVALETAKDLSVIDIVIEKTNRIIRTFDAVLRISKLGKVDSKAPVELVSLNSIAQLLYELYADSVKDNDQSLSIELGEETMIRGDRQLIAQLGSNLIENSMKYAGSKAKIKIKVDNNLFLIVDNGTGLSIENREKLAKPLFKDGFLQNDNSGLGLALVNAIVNYHRGSLFLEETLGGGLTVKTLFSTTKT